MNSISPKKLLHSKWTATAPSNKEKHFTITEVEYDEEANVAHCLIQAVMSKNEYPIDWRDLKKPELWRQGWK